MSFHVTYNFVQGYDAGQKKIVASEIDQNFADIEGYINNSSVNIAETQTITGDKTFTGTVDLSGASVVGGPYINAAEAAHAAMPSGQYIELTLPASGGTVTAPADGLMFFSKTATAASQYANLLVGSVQVAQALYCATESSATGQNLTSFIPVKKDTVVYVSYNAAGATNAFRFIYANGSAPTV